jgi:hypothetical protein
MVSAEFIRAVRERLNPSVYPGLLQTRGSPFDLLLVRSRGRMAHDVFGVLELKPGQDARSLIESARADVAARFGRLCYRHSMVMHLLVHGPIEAWQAAIGALCADRTGFRGVMVQSIYTMDPATGAGHKSVSSWGRLSFSRPANAAAEQVEGTVSALFAG